MVSNTNLRHYLCHYTKAVSQEMKEAPQPAKRKSWLKSSKITRLGGLLAGAMAGGMAAGPLAPAGMLMGAAAGYYSSRSLTDEAKVRAHWFDVVKAALGPDYRVVQTVVLLQMRLIIIATVRVYSTGDDEKAPL